MGKSVYSHEKYLQRKAAGKIKPASKEKQKEYSKRWYARMKAQCEAEGRPMPWVEKPREYDPEKRKEMYERQKESGELIDSETGKTKYYAEEMKKDPLYNRKRHIRNKAKDLHWEDGKNERYNYSLWLKLVLLIKESDDAPEELAETLARDYNLSRRSRGEHDYNRTIYRPRIRNSVLTQEQIEEITGFTLKHGLTPETEVIKTSVIYAGEMEHIDDKREEKQVDIYTSQNKYLGNEETGGGYLKEKKLHV